METHIICGIKRLACNAGLLEVIKQGLMHVVSLICTTNVLIET